nr:autotransporter outer membrane beta-barrel domain-containing protein [Serratia quinivorans]
MKKLSIIISSALTLSSGVVHAETNPDYALSESGVNISEVNGVTINGNGNAGTAGFSIYDQGTLSIKNSVFTQTASGNEYNIDLSGQGASGNQQVSIDSSTLNSSSNTFNLAGFGVPALGYSEPSNLDISNSRINAADTVFMSDDGNNPSNTNIGITNSVVSGGTLAENNNGIMNLTAQSSVLSGKVTSTGDNTTTDMGLTAGSIWDVTGDSNLSQLDVLESTVNLSGGNVSTSQLNGGINANLISYYNTTTGSYNQIDADSASGTFNVGIHSSGNDSGLNGSTIVNVVNNSATFNGMTSDNGAWKYNAVTQENENGSTSVIMQKTDQLSTGANAALSAASAAINVWNMESDTLNQRMSASRRNPNDQGGVWASYYGGSNHTTTDANASYHQNTNGVMLGADSQFNTDNGHWLIGAAMSQEKSNLSMTGANGDIDSTGVQAYLSRRYNNGLFIDSSAKFEHFSNSQNVISSDGAQSDGNYGTNGYGISLKGGYTYDGGSYFIEPYAKGSAMTLSGVDYTTSNRMQVNNGDYNSLRVEAGSELGTTANFGNGGMIKPYLHLAVVDELSNDNTVSINGEQFNDSINGAALQSGVGAQVQLNNALGAYANMNYTKGHDVESPWQANVGMSYTW